MPDTGAGLGLRSPVVRRLSSSSSSKFSSSPSSPSPLSRSGSVRSAFKSQRDTALEGKVLQWISDVLGEAPKDGDDYERFIQDGTVISRLMTAIVFNSVPQEDIDQRWGCDADRARVKGAISEMRRYLARQHQQPEGGDMFEAEDLIQLRNVPKVTRCLAQLAKVASADKDSLLACRT